MTTVDCDDPKNKDNASCDLSRSFGELLVLPALVTIMTLGVWIVGGIIIALIRHHSSPEHRTAILVTGISVCVLIAPIGILLLQKFAHWPLGDI